MSTETDQRLYAALIRLAEEPADEAALHAASEAVAAGLPPSVDPADATTAVLLWQTAGRGFVPTLVGDHNGWTQESGHTHAALPGLAWWVLRLRPASRIEYVFVDPQGAALPDPRNPWVTYSGFGAMSELPMPGYVRHPAVEPFRTGRKGSTEGMQELRIDSRHLGYPVTVYVDLPQPDADGPVRGGRCPMLLFNDGLDYVEFAQAPHMLQWLGRHGHIPPTTGVYVCPPNRHRPDAPNRTTEYGMNPDYATFLALELVPAVEAEFPVGGDRSLRATVGDSYGGLCALFTSLSHPEVFGGAYSQSGYVGFRGDALFPLVQQRGGQIAFCFDVGEYEHVVGADFLDPGELDFTAANLRLRDLMRQRAVPHHFDLQPQGHTWGFWRDGLLKNLPALLRFMSTLC